jgi:hypothetical protein
MSVVFSNYLQEDSNKNGYFRIGTVVLNIPPTNIITEKIINNNRKTILRGKNEMFTKSGQSRWDVTVTWKSILSGGQDKYSSWEDLQTILAMFKVAPFVEVESPHLRQIFAEKDPKMSASRLAFGLRQMKVDTDPDIVDGLIVTLTMTYFNYHPYTLDFGYTQAKSATTGTDAYKSDAFTAYLDSWKKKNLIPQGVDNYFHAADWKTQLTATSNGKVKLNWKRYRAVVAPIKTADVTSTATTYAKVLGPTANAGSTYSSVPVSAQKGISATNMALINTLAPSAAAAAIQWLSAVGQQGYDYTITSAKRSYQDQAGLYAAYEAQGGTKAVGKPGGPKYLVGSPGKLNSDGSVTGGSQHESGLCLDIVFTNNSGFQYAKNSSGQFGWSWPFPIKDTVHWKYTGGISQATSQPPNILGNTPVKNASGTEIFQNLGAITSITPEMQALINAGWVFDYLTENIAFFFLPETVNVEDSNGLIPSQISVLFVNNLAQIPLANYQYPTYQHIGPASSLISIQMTSVGTGSEEPQHEVLSEMTSMVHTMEDQFLDLRSTFRSVQSIHGMQAVFVENTVLNLLGIYSVLPEQVSTEVVLESANMVQATFLAHQYENIYEETAPYRINGITGSYVKALQGIIGSNSLTKPGALSNEEQSQLSKVLQFQKDYDGADRKELGKWILLAATEPTNGNFIGSFSNNPTITLPSAQVSQLVQPLVDNAGGKYAVLLPRAKAAVAGSSLTYADYLAFTTYNPTAGTTVAEQQDATFGLALALPPGFGVTQNNVTTTQAQLASINSALASQINNIPNSTVLDMYKSVLVYISNADPIFASQVQKLVASPTYKAQFQSAVSGTNPSQSNPGHGAYQDLGLDDGSNPDEYFVNYNEQYKDLAQQTLGNVAAAVAATSAETNSPTPGNSTPLISTVTTTGVPTDPNVLMKMLNIPGYSMREAFPTFKLFFMEDCNSGVYYAFDNFYSYASVLEVEVIRAWDKPATAVIRLTNISHLFDHKLFDNTMVGRHERNLSRFNTTQSSSSTTTNSEGTAELINKNPITGTISGRDIREGYDPANPKLIPMKYFPLQTGSKIQLRFGFDNDPDKLTPVFNGMVTEIEEGELGEIIITAQSFLLELITVPVENPTNSYWSLSTVPSAVAKVAAFGFISLQEGPAYGGFGVFSDGGDAQSVIGSLLKVAQAKHFGHWQINTAAPDQLLKGYHGWIELSTAAAQGTGNPNVAAAIGNATDRSADNIMVNSYIDYTGAINSGRGTRAFKDQADNGISLNSLVGNFSYFVDSSTEMTVWELIKDVSRRYPEYLLLEKFYGFPYEADATLVFGSPLDWYFTRPALIGDDEAVRAADSNNAIFKEWYNTTGRVSLQEIYDEANKGWRLSIIGLVSFLFTPTGSSLSRENNVDLAAAGTDYASFQATLNQLSSLANGIGVQVPKVRSETNRTIQRLADLNRSYIVSVSMKSGTNSTLNDGRIKPIRKYHFIDHNTIVHNSIKLNDKIYNAIKITGSKDKKGERYVANTQIPAQHTRVLDVSDRINDPDQNILRQNLGRLVSGSFLKEEVGKMYRGELILRGVPEIEPMDILMLLDASTGIVGPIEVEQVIHSFSQEMGYVTIVKPRCLIVVNEIAGASTGRGFMFTMQSCMAKMGFGGIADMSDGVDKQIANGLAIAAIIPLLLGSAFYYWADTNYNLNPIIIQPLARFGHPWIGGMEGFELTGLLGHYSDAFAQLMADEIWPLIDLYKAANSITD